MRVLIIDNYDSFTYNLYQYVGEILTFRGNNTPVEVTVKRNNEISLSEVEAFAADRIIISPGPGDPSNPAYFGVCSQVITELGQHVPLLGVCLGMQGIAHCFGGDIIRAPLPMHGKVSKIRHDGLGVYQDMPQDLGIMRYHSLIAEPSSLPDCLEITSVATGNNLAPDEFRQAAAQGAEIMGVRHKHFPIEGIQYHPESFATEGGKELLANFLFRP